MREKAVWMDRRDMLAQCGLVVKGDGRIVRATARELLPLLNAKIDRLMRLAREQQAEISRLKEEISRLEEE
jgi:hypothetical protein